MRGQIRMSKNLENEINRSVPLISDTMRLWETTAAFMWYQRHTWKKVVNMNYNRSSQDLGRKEKEGITVLIVEPMKEPYIKTIVRGLKPLQNEVNGHIEAIFPFDDPVAIILNSDGKYQGLAWNRGLYNGRGELCDVIAGTFLVVGVKGEDFISLSEKLAAKYMEKYRIPEQFTCVNEGGIGIPMSYSGRLIYPEEGLKSGERKDRKLVCPEVGAENGLRNKECRGKEEGTGRNRKKRKVYEER